VSLKSDSEDTDVSAIKQVMRQELSITWSREKAPDWDAFADTFLPGASLFPAARPVKTQTLDQFIERMKRLRDEGKLESFEVTPLGCDVRVFGNVAVAFAACEMLKTDRSLTGRLTLQSWSARTAAGASLLRLGTLKAAHTSYPVISPVKFAEVSKDRFLTGLFLANFSAATTAVCHQADATMVSPSDRCGSKVRVAARTGFGQ